MSLRVRRAYDPPAPDDGCRVLVDRLWPRGLTKERAAVQWWLKDVAPSTELRKWFGHDPAKWEQFQVRYRKELGEKKDAVDLLKQKAKDHTTLTLVYGARDELTGSCGSVINLFEERYGHRPAVFGSVRAEESVRLLKDFFREKR